MNKKGYFEIWQPRWHDKKVLLACRDVLKNATNIVRFTRTKSMDNEYTISGEDIVSCPVESNGKLDCYAVPLDKLHKVEKISSFDPFYIEKGE